MRIVSRIFPVIICFAGTMTLVGSDRYAPDSFEYSIEESDAFAVTDKIKSIDKNMLPAYRALAEKKKNELIARKRTVGEWLCGAIGGALMAVGGIVFARAFKPALGDELCVALLISAVGAHVLYYYWWYPAIVREARANVIAEALQFKEEHS